MKTVLLAVLGGVLISFSSTTFAVEYGGCQADCPKECTKSEKRSGTYWAYCGSDCHKTMLNAPKSNDSGYVCWR